MKLEIELNESDWQFATDKSNEQARQIHDQEQANKPAKEQKPFQPASVEDYARTIIASVEASYRFQRENAFLQEQLSDPTIRARALELLSNPEKRDQAITLADS